MRIISIIILAFTSVSFFVLSHSFGQLSKFSEFQSAFLSFYSQINSFFSCMIPTIVVGFNAICARIIFSLISQQFFFRKIFDLIGISLIPVLVYSILGCVHLLEVVECCKGVGIEKAMVIESSIGLSLQDFNKMRLLPWVGFYLTFFLGLIGLFRLSFLNSFYVSLLPSLIVLILRSLI